MASVLAIHVLSRISVIPRKGAFQDKFLNHDKVRPRLVPGSDLLECAFPTRNTFFIHLSLKMLLSWGRKRRLVSCSFPKVVNRPKNVLGLSPPENVGFSLNSKGASTEMKTLRVHSSIACVITERKCNS